MCSTQELHYLNMQCVVAAGHYRSAMVGGTAISGAYHSTGSFNDRNQCLHIVRLETRLDDDIDKARRQHAIGIAVAAPTHQPRLPRYTIKGGALLRVAEYVRVVDINTADDRFPQVRVFNATPLRQAPLAEPT